MSSARTALIAALPRELAPLVRGWRREASEPGIVVYSSERAVAVCAGMGPQRAALAVTTGLRFASDVEQVLSVGWAGALRESLRAGTVVWPRLVIDAGSGERYETEHDGGALVTAGSVAGVAEKTRLRTAYGADLADMEAAAVARMARARGIRFAAVKAISDEWDFELPGMDGFVSARGEFREGAFGGYVALRPWLWGRVRTMATHSGVAAKNLCAELDAWLAGG